MVLQVVLVREGGFRKFELSRCLIASCWTSIAPCKASDVKH